MEQVWLGAWELSAWTWMAWTAPVKAISSTHNEHRNFKRPPVCEVCPAFVKRECPHPKAYRNYR